MPNIVFSGPAWVEIQGDRVLRFVALKDDHAEYEVIGFDDPIIVRDYRPVGLRAIRQLLKTEQLDEFAPKFNSPAEIKITESGLSQVKIDLRKTSDKDPANRLWIAIGIRDSIPVYHYLFERLVPLDNKGFAFLALYERCDQWELPRPSVLALT